MVILVDFSQNAMAYLYFISVFPNEMDLLLKHLVSTLTCIKTSAWIRNYLLEALEAKAFMYTTVWNSWFVYSTTDMH